MFYARGGGGVNEEWLFSLSLATSPGVKEKDATKERQTTRDNTVRNIYEMPQFGKNGRREQVLLEGEL